MNRPRKAARIQKPGLDESRFRINIFGFPFPYVNLDIEMWAC